MKLTVLTLLSAAAFAGIAWSQDPNADNTEKNTRDRDDQSKTATDQSNNPADQAYGRHSQDGRGR